MSSDDDLEFKSPKKTAKKQKLSSEAPAIAISNQFNDLQDIEMNPSTTKATISSKIRNEVKTNFQRKMKPIIVENIETKEVQRILSKENLKTQGEFKFRNGKFHLLTHIKEDKNKILKYLQERSIPHHTFSEPEDRHNIFVLKGHYTVEPAVLHSILTDNGIPATSVGLISNSKSNPIFAVHFTKNTTSLATLNQQHNTIDNLKVNWVRYDINSKRPTQCKRCQSWGHSAKNCGNSARCVKCLLAHGVGECTRKDPKEGHPSCVNCGKSGHPSNSTTCEKYISYKQFLDSRIKKGYRQPPHSRQQQVAENVSLDFPPLNPKEPSAPRSSLVQKRLTVNAYDVCASTYAKPIPSRTMTNSFDQFVNLQNEFSQIPDMDEAFKILSRLINELKKSNSPNEKASILFKFFNYQQCN